MGKVAGKPAAQQTLGRYHIKARNSTITLLSCQGAKRTFQSVRRSSILKGVMLEVLPGSREKLHWKTVVQGHDGEKGRSTTFALIWTSTVCPLASPTESKQAQTMYDYSLLNMLQPPPLTPTSWDSSSTSPTAPTPLNHSSLSLKATLSRKCCGRGRGLERILVRVGLTHKVEGVRSVDGRRDR